MEYLQDMTADEAMIALKSMKHNITEEDLIGFYNAGIKLLNKYQVTHQVAAAKKLLFHMDCCIKEIEIIKKGINTFLYADDVREYMQKVATNDVKLIEIENYDREIPDEVVEVIKKVDGLFSSLWILYTDYAYTDKEKQSQREIVDDARRSYDPILFGVMLDEDLKTVSERYYFLADWVDEKCDLTLEKLLNEMTIANPKENILHEISTPTNVDAIREQLDNTVLIKGKYIVQNKKKNKKSFFQKIRTFWCK